MTPLNFTIGDSEYQLLPHTGFVAINLDRKVLGLFGSIFGGTKGVDNSNAFVALADALSNLSDSEYRWMVETTLSRVTVKRPGKKAISLGTEEAIAEHFHGQMQNLYAVLFEVWKQEKLSPFAMAPETEQSGS